TVVAASQVALAAGLAFNAARRSAGTTGSSSLSRGAIATATVSPGAALAASRSALGTFSQWLPLPSGSSVASNGAPPSVPPTLVMLRVGNFALASAGRSRNVQLAPF